MTFLAALAWSGAIILAIVVLLFITLGVLLGRAVVQERRLVRLEAEAAEAKLQADRQPFAPRMPDPWRFDDDHLTDPNSPHDLAP